MKIKTGQLIVITAGTHDEYEIVDFSKAVKDFHTEELKKEFFDLGGDLSTYVVGRPFYEWLINQGYIVSIYETSSEVI